MYHQPIDHEFILRGKIDQNYSDPLPLLMAKLRVLALEYNLELEASQLDRDGRRYPLENYE